MSVVTSYKLMKDAGENGYAVPAFNIDNLESALAVSQVMKETGLPVIVQTIPRTLNYGGVSTYPAMMKALMEDCDDVDYAMHLDHGSSAELAAKCIECGFSSVMYDGSALSFEENVKNTCEVTALALDRGISVEGELGTIGGKEEGDTDLEASYTKVSEAVEFVDRTKVSTLAIGVGTAHGVYKGIPKINIKRIEEIKAAVSAPLVLHGASGLDDEVLRQCIAAGITKINFATELRQAYTAGIKQGFKNNPDAFDPKIYMPEAIESIKSVILSKIKICYHLK
ncbi:MAG: class II fructose-bisphosphate aldolase [Clostridia bacterium]|nr:class II fructose-bisphosphate aldolase [Clostridia bacterium]